MGGIDEYLLSAESLHQLTFDCMADSKSLSAASLAVCRAISSQFKVNSS